MISGVAIVRGKFSIEQKTNIADEALRIDPGTKHLRLDSERRKINVRKGIARRHVVSAYDMGKHYMDVLNKKKNKVSAGKLLLEQRGSLPEARTPVGSRPRSRRSGGGHQSLQQVLRLRQEHLPR